MSEFPLDPKAYAAWFETPLGKRVWQDETRALFRLLGPLEGKRVLDAGCGEGRLAVELAKRGARVSGVDRSEAMLAAARERARREGVTLELKTGEIAALPFESESFDLALTTTVLCFCVDARPEVRDLARVLRPGGRLVLGELGRWSPWALGRYLRGRRGDPLWKNAHAWSTRELKRLLRDAALAPRAAAGAVFYPRSALIARLVSPLEPVLGRVTRVGAAFVAVAADKPVSGVH